MVFRLWKSDGLHHSISPPKDILFYQRVVVLNISEIDQSKSVIFGMHYTLLNDDLGNKYLQKLSAALDRGVKVFLCIDSLMSELDPEIEKQLRDKGAKILLLKNSKYKQFP